MKLERKNIYLYFGVGLPVSLLVICLLLSLITNFLVSPPQYKVIFSKGNHYGLDISIKNKKIEIKQTKQNIDHVLPTIVIFNPQTKISTEYEILKKHNNYIVPKFPSTIDINTNKVSPDGYQFYCNTSSIFNILLNNHKKCVLYKQTRTTTINSTNTYSNIFLGWIINDQQ